MRMSLWGPDKDVPFLGGVAEAPCEDMETLTMNRKERARMTVMQGWATGG